MHKYARHCGQRQPLNYRNVPKTALHDLFNRLIVGRSADKGR